MSVMSASGENWCLDDDERGRKVIRYDVLAGYRHKEGKSNVPPGRTEGIVKKLKPKVR